MKSRFGFCRLKERIDPPSLPCVLNTGVNAYHVGDMSMPRHNTLYDSFNRQLNNSID
ncbi:hypothetical protein SBDP1_650020 [Syntrophobacter sp. SbD1]|nr:hypothetical protein SBDP1_650020 [Syntrophobacter sp. SbD1]